MSPTELKFVYDGWNGYNRSLITAISPLNREQLCFRSIDDMPSVGELAWHIGDGRVDWFRRMDAPLSRKLWARIEQRESAPLEPAQIVAWLDQTWQMIDETLAQWTVNDLTVSYNHPYRGKVYAVSRQWTIWRIMAHDIHHGGQLSELLAMQGILPLELTLLGGHLTEPPTVD